MSGNEQEYKYWGKLAGTFHEDAIYVVGPDVYQEVGGWLQNQFENTDTALELGCGTGFFSGIIADRVKHLTATDFALEMIGQAKKNLQVQFCEGAHSNLGAITSKEVRYELYSTLKFLNRSQMSKYHTF